jgi:hypothetical protein
VKTKAIAEAANEFLSSLDDAQRAAATRPLGDETERRTWYYWPAPRAGLAIGAMTPDQQKLAHYVVAEVLSHVAYAKVHAIIALERVLDEIEQRQGSRRGLPRDPALYYLTIFGEPSASEPWSFRFEGHHVSVHIAAASEDIRCTPCFLGANPAVVWHDGRVVTRPLGEEEDVARELLASLDDAQRTRAVTSLDAPDDILTMNAPKLDVLPNGGGLSAADMGAGQRELLELLVSVYVERMCSDVAGAEMDRLYAAGLERIEFAWAGSLERGERHYYRLSGPTFLAEYDNTQDNANHVHAVWRDLERDFGTDLLRAHLAQHHE